MCLARTGLAGGWQQGRPAQSGTRTAREGAPVVPGSLQR